MKRGFKKIDHSLPSVSISINKQIDGNYDISRAIKESYFKIKRNYPSVDNYSIEVRLILSCKFDTLNINNIFPQKVDIYQCEGNQLNITKISPNSIDNPNQLARITIIDSQITLINISANLMFLFLHGAKFCKSFILNPSPSDKIKMDSLSVSGQFDSIQIENISTIKLSLNIQTDANNIRSNKVCVKLTNLKLDTFYIKNHKEIFFDLNKSNVQELNFDFFHKANIINILESKINSINIKSHITGIDKIIIKQCEDIENLSIIPTNDLESGSSVLLKEIEVHKTAFKKDFIGTISNFYLDSIKLKNCINRGELNFENILIKEHFQIFNSIMGNTVFINSNIGSELMMENSNIENIKNFTTELPDKIFIKSNKKTDLKNIQDGYRQLKIISEKSSNKEKFINYRSKELDTYYSSLSFLSKKQVLEKITVGLNKISNKHGMSWWRPFWLYFALSTILYFCFLLSLGGFYNYGGYIYVNDGVLLKYLADWYIPSYLYPAKNKLSPFLDCFSYPDFTALPILSKAIVVVNDILLMPYLIYQFIAAFRRYGTK
jgi:hypothetical protein